MEYQVSCCSQRQLSFTLTVLFMNLLDVTTVASQGNVPCLIHHGEYLEEGTTLLVDELNGVNNGLMCTSSRKDGNLIWQYPSGKTVDCDEQDNEDPFLCEYDTSPLYITLYKRAAQDVAEHLLGIYRCSLDKPERHVSINIAANTILSFFSDLYVELPKDVTAIPQHYLVHCVMSSDPDDVSVMGLIQGLTFNDPASYCSTDPAVSCSSKEVVIGNTHELIANVTLADGFKPLPCDGNHIITCEALGETQDVIIRAPCFNISRPVVDMVYATNASISWALPSSSPDADGYIIYYNNGSGSDISVKVKGGNVSKYTLEGLAPSTTYTITIRAYQDILGPASGSVQVTTHAVDISELTWMLLSDHNSQLVEYQVNCTTYGDPMPSVKWTVGSSAVETLASQYAISENVYQNSLTVSGNLTTTHSVSCSLLVEEMLLTKSILIKAPEGPPTNITVVAVSSSQLTLSWLAPLDGASGYVVLYSLDGSETRWEKLVDGGDILQSTLSNLTLGTYQICMFAYKMLPSESSFKVDVAFNVPPVVESLVMTLSVENFVTVSWVPPTGFPITAYELTYIGICDKAFSHQILPGNQTNVTVELKKQQRYHLILSAENVVGLGEAASIDIFTGEGRPSGAPQSVFVQTISTISVLVTWEEVDCYKQGAGVTGYLIQYRLSGTRKRQEEWSLSVTADKLSLTIDSLQPDSDYSFSVAALNAFGTGPFTPSITAETFEFFSVSISPTSTVIDTNSLGVDLIIIVVLAMVIVVVVAVVTLILVRRKVEIRFNRKLSKQAEGRKYSFIHFKLPAPRKRTVTTCDSDGCAKKSSDVEDLASSIAVLNTANGLFRSHVPQVLPVNVEDFAEHVEKCHSNINSSFFEQFQEKLWKDYGAIPTTVGNLPYNKQFNRFNNITVYDTNRVLLRPIFEGMDYHGDFINASYIDGYSSSRKFIATQGPLQNTITDFWHMVWQEGVCSIVMVANIIEQGQLKCEQYWPNKVDRQSTYGPFTLTLISQQILPDLVERKLELKIIENSTPVHLVHYQFTSWPDHGVPDNPTSLLSLHKRVMSGLSPESGPILVHCSAGVGRTGTFIALDMALEQADMKGEIDIAGIVSKLRQQRMKMVQSEAQYIFIHDVTLEETIVGKTQIPCEQMAVILESWQIIHSETRKTSFQLQFQILGKMTPDPSQAIRITALNHMDKNRSSHYLPLERWRVNLKRESPGYIHASFVDGYKNKRAFIIAQSPMDNTLRDFWKMVIDWQVPAIVMLCDQKEGEQVTCSQYWPEEEVSHYQELRVELTSITKKVASCTRELTVTMDNQKLSVTQFQILDWTDDGKVRETITILEVIEEVIRVQQKRGRGPVVVHCSDTVSRSGIYCAVSNALEQCKAEGVVDVFQAVRAIRMQKPGAVTSEEQYKEIYDIIMGYIELHETYANFQ